MQKSTPIVWKIVCGQVELINMMPCRPHAFPGGDWNSALFWAEYNIPPSKVNYVDMWGFQIKQNGDADLH